MLRPSQPRLRAQPVIAAATSRKPHRAKRKQASFAGLLQRARTMAAGLTLLSDARDGADTVAALHHLALLCPRAADAEATASSLRRNPTLNVAVDSLVADGALGAAARCDALWSLAMLFPAWHASAVRPAASATPSLSRAPS